MWFVLSKVGHIPQIPHIKGIYDMANMTALSVKKEANKNINKNITKNSAKQINNQQPLFSE